MPPPPPSSRTWHRPPPDDQNRTVGVGDRTQRTTPDGVCAPPTAARTAPRPGSRPLTPAGRRPSGHRAHRPQGRGTAAAGAGRRWQPRTAPVTSSEGRVAGASDDRPGHGRSSVPGFHPLSGECARRGGMARPGDVLSEAGCSKDGLRPGVGARCAPSQPARLVPVHPARPHMRGRPSLSRRGFAPGVRAGRSRPGAHSPSTSTACCKN